MAAAAEKTADDVPDMQEALENALATEPMNSQGQTVQMPTIPPEEKETPLQADEIVLAIPARSVEEILQEAYRDGEDPKVEKDELTGVTFVGSRKEFEGEGAYGRFPVLYDTPGRRRAARSGKGSSLADLPWNVSEKIQFFFGWACFLRKMLVK